MKRLALTSILTGAALMAQAGVVFQAGNFNGGDNVLSGSIEGPAIVVKGQINSGGPVVVFTNLDGYLMHYTGGQASLHPDSENFPLMDFGITMEDPDYWMAGIGMSIDADEDGTVLFSAYTNENVQTQTFDYSHNGENKYRILVDGATQILGLRVETTTALEDVKQVRIHAVPEPATLAMLGLGALGAFRRRNRR